MNAARIAPTDPNRSAGSNAVAWATISRTDWGTPMRSMTSFLQYRIDPIALIARKAFKMLSEGFIHNDDDGSKWAGPPMPACCERDRKPDAS